MKTLVLLSGGMDSAVVLAVLQRDGHECCAVGFDYGQPHVLELGYAESLAKEAGVSFERVSLPVIRKSDDVVFAARNAVLLSVAASMAVGYGCNAIAIGCNSTDWLRFPDCRPAFMRSIGAALRDAYGVHVLAPLLRTPKFEVQKMACELGVGPTWSCYSPQGGAPCGACLACQVLVGTET